MGSLARCAHSTELVAPVVGTTDSNFVLLDRESFTSEAPVMGDFEDIPLTSHTTTYDLDNDGRASFVSIPIPTVNGMALSPVLAPFNDFVRVLTEHPKDTMQGEHGTTLFNRMNIVDDSVSGVDVKRTLTVDGIRSDLQHDPTFLLDGNVQIADFDVSVRIGGDNWFDYTFVVIKFSTREPEATDSWHKSRVYFGAGFSNEGHEPLGLYPVALGEAGLSRMTILE